MKGMTGRLGTLLYRSGGVIVAVDPDLFNLQLFLVPLAQPVLPHCLLPLHRLPGGCPALQ